MDRKITYVIALLIAFILASPVVSAIQPTQQYNKIFLDPFYRNSMSNGQTYNYSISINPPDGLSSIKSAIISMEVWISPTVNFTLLVDGKPCNTPFYYISTTYASSGLARANFDCTNIMNGKGNYTVSIKPLQANTGSSTVWLDLTYMNKPIPSIFISGTEYQIDDTATVFLQIINATSQSVNNAICFMNAYYPNKTIFLNNIKMTYLYGSDGLYYYDFIVPNDIGIYMLTVNCNFYYNLTYNRLQNDTFVDLAFPTTNYGNLTYFSIGRNGNSTYYGYLMFDISNITSIQINSAEIYLYQNLGLVNVPVVTVQRVTSAWNEYNVTWNTKPTNDAYIWDKKAVQQGWYYWNITGLVQGWVNGTYTNYGVFLNISPSIGTLNYTTPPSKESGGAYQPYLIVEYEINEQINEIRGSGELHIKNLPFDIWSYTNRTLTDYNQTLMFTFLKEINATEYNTVSLINSVNGSLYISINQVSVKIDDINNSINNHMINILNQLASVNASIHNSIFGINGSIMTKLYGIQNEISSINGSIFTELYSIHTELSGVVGNLTNITDTILGVNSSLSSELMNVQMNVDNLGIQLDAVNNSVMNKLYAMQGEITSVNNTALESNISIMNKLYMIQGDLDDLLQNLTYQLINLSNLTMNISFDTSRIASDVWEIFFRRGTPPLAPSTDYYCKPSDPNVLIKNITYNYKGQPTLSGYFSKEEEELCSYGCVNQSIFTGHAVCDFDPTSKYLIAIAIIAIIIIILFIINRHYGSEEQ
jgi:hypothetical protein